MNGFSGFQPNAFQNNAFQIVHGAAAGGKDAGGWQYYPRPEITEESFDDELSAILLCAF